MARDNYNLGRRIDPGRNPVAGREINPLRGANDAGVNQDAAVSDSEKIKLAQDAIILGDVARAKDILDTVFDPILRSQARTAIQLPGGVRRPGQVPPGLHRVPAQGQGPIDPKRLFFMLVFYLSSHNPRFSWSMVLRAANRISGRDDFQEIPNQAPVDLLTGDRGNFFRGQGFTEEEQGDFVGTQETANPQSGTGLERRTANIRAQIEQAAQGLRERLNEPSSDLQSDAGSRGGSGGSNTGVESIQPWPIQNLPTIDGGITKSVDFSNDAKWIGVAEPLITHNQGASAIETSLSFEYAVGLPDLDAPITADGETPKNLWTTEHVMGMIYLAMSLVFPWESKFGRDGATATNDEGDDSVRQGEAQFPVVFLRHYSLFPFLTPFVVTEVKIEPDEGQPLLITDSVNLQQVESHLAASAIRQIVRITLNLRSAHFYLPVFKPDSASSGGTFTTGDQLSKQTSGSTYLQMAQQLLGEGRTNAG